MSCPHAGGPAVHLGRPGPAVLRLKQLNTQDLIDASMLAAVKGGMTPGTSALVLLSVDAAADTVARAFEGHAMELIRPDLSVQQEDRLRAAAFAASSPDPQP